MSHTPSNDPMDFLKNMLGSMSMPLPGMVTPTLDTDELEKRVKDLKAVEGWLKTNLGMLQMTIQGLEMQRTTLVAMQNFSQSANSGEATANAFANPAMWPWNFMQQATAAATAGTSAATAADAAESAKTEAKSAKSKK